MRGWGVGEILQEGSVVRQKVAGQTLGSRGQKSAAISNLEREVSRTKNWCYFCRGSSWTGSGKSRRKSVFLGLTSHLILFISTFDQGEPYTFSPCCPVPEKNPPPPPQSSFWALSASVRQFHGENCAKQCSTKVHLRVTSSFVWPVHGASRGDVELHSLWLSFLLRFHLVSLT